MESNDLSEGEELSREACFEKFYTSFKYHLVDDQQKKEQFKSLIKYMISHGVIRAKMYEDGKVVYSCNKNLITKSEFYCLMANVYVHFFGTSLAMKMFIIIFCGLFDHNEKEIRSVYVTMRRYRNKEIPVSYTKFF
jgi:hypothetical protein